MQCLYEMFIIIFYIDRRDKSYNYFSLMVQKRLKDNAADDANKAEEEEKKKVTATKTKSLVSVNINWVL